MSFGRPRRLLRKSLFKKYKLKLNNRKLNVLELFGGVGATSTALKNLGFNVNIADYVDFNTQATTAFNILFNTNFSPTDINQYHYQGPKLDLVLFGSPCQDFSIAGYGAGGEKDSGTRSSLLWEAVRVVEKMKEKPKFVIWENVASVIQKKYRHIYHQYVNEIKKLGYKNIYTYVLQATDFGIPQTRKRVFVVAIKENIKPKPLFNKKMRPLIDFIDTEFNPKKYSYITKKWLKNNKHYQKNKKEKYFCKDKLKIYFGPFQTDNKVALVSKEYSNTIIGTLTAQGSLRDQKLAIPINNNINDEVAIFDINNEKWVIRQIYALENWKLMGFKEEEYWKLINIGFSNSKIKFLAGNSIVVDVLENLFKGIGVE